MRRLGWLAAAAGACAAAWALALAPPAAPRAATRESPRAVQALGGLATSAPAPPARPPSIADVDEDGRLTAGPAGELVVDVELRRFLDFHLLATGEEPPEVTRARLERLIDARLPPRAAREARELLGRYLAMREAARRLAAAPDEDLAVRLAAVRELRRTHLGAAAAEAMFGAEEAEAEAALARRAGATTATALDPAAVPLAAMRAEETRSADEVRALRVRTFGEAGAERLAALDDARAAWERRLAAFRARRAELPAERAGELLRSSFSTEEQLRVRAIERAAGRPLD